MSPADGAGLRGEILADVTRVAAIVVACLAPALGGCGDDRATDPSEAGAISYSRSGGIAGTPESLEIAADGSATLTVGGPDPQTGEFQVPPAELEEITSAIETIGIAALDQGISDGCADCFVYELELDGETASADSVTSTAAFADAIAPLEALMEEHRSRAD